MIKQEITFNGSKSVLLFCRDITQMKENLRLHEENRVINLMTSYVSHEMLTPLKCMHHLTITMTNNEKTEPDDKHYLRIIG